MKQGTEQTAPVADLLNAAQRRSLTIGLRAFEMHLRQAATTLEKGEERGVLYRRNLSLSAERRAKMHEQINLALAQIAALAKRFGLKAVEEDPASAIAAQMSVDWANLCDLRTDRLRRYGDVDVRLTDVLDADLAVLAECALSLAASSRDLQTP